MKEREEARKKRHRRILLKMHGTPDRPRIVVGRSLKNISARLIDDTQGKIIFSLSTLSKDIKQKLPALGNIKGAELLGQVFAQRAKEKGITKVIFDRAGYLYHGRIKAFAETLRKGGLEL